MLKLKNKKRKTHFISKITNIEKETERRWLKKSMYVYFLAQFTNSRIYNNYYI